MKKDRSKNRRPEPGSVVKSAPQRTCAGCRKPLDQDLLVRYVLSPQGEIIVDYRRKLPGRGVYTCLNYACVDAAVKRGQLNRSLKGGRVASTDVLCQALQEQIRCKVLNLVGMARKAGQVVSGTRQVLSEVQAGKHIGLLLRASDLSAAIADKVDRTAQRSGIPCFALFGKEHMGQLLGKSERGVVALRSGSLAASIVDELERLDKFAGELNG